MAETLTREQAERALAEIEFQETVWDGCVHLDCIEGCSHHPDHWRCERFERAFEQWAAFPSKEGDRG